MSFIQIASWNIEHLDGSSRKDRPQSAFALADHIEMAGIDVAVLQEIYVTAHGEQITINDGVNAVPIAALPVHGKTRRNATLDIVCFLLEEHLDDVWRYIILPNRHAGDESQLIAVVFNQTRLSLKAVTALDVAHSDDGDSLWDRKPHVVELTSSIPVWYRDASGAWQQTPQTRSLSVVPLHMKSNYGGVTKNRRVRAKEAATLCEALEKVQDQI
ncbi:MAG: hypothetical protein KC619_20490, partial [Myxococcales bacterium]|nr:hypothetical protein [Myxococcales bacterium]